MFSCCNNVDEVRDLRCEGFINSDHSHHPSTKLTFSDFDGWSAIHQEFGQFVARVGHNQWRLRVISADFDRATATMLINYISCTKLFGLKMCNEMCRVFCDMESFSEVFKSMNLNFYCIYCICIPIISMAMAWIIEVFNKNLHGFCHSFCPLEKTNRKGLVAGHVLQIAHNCWSTKCCCQESHLAKTAKNVVILVLKLQASWTPTVTYHQQHRYKGVTSCEKNGKIKDNNKNIWSFGLYYKILKMPFTKLTFGLLIGLIFLEILKNLAAFVFVWHQLTIKTKVFLSQCQLNRWQNDNGIVCVSHGQRFCLTEFIGFGPRSRKRLQAKKIHLAREIILSIYKT